MQIHSFSKPAPTALFKPVQPKDVEEKFVDNFVEQMNRLGQKEDLRGCLETVPENRQMELKAMAREQIRTALANAGPVGPAIAQATLNTLAQFESKTTEPPGEEPASVAGTTPRVSIAQAGLQTLVELSENDSNRDQFTNNEQVLGRLGYQMAGALEPQRIAEGYKGLFHEYEVGYSHSAATSFLKEIAQADGGCNGLEKHIAAATLGSHVSGDDASIRAFDMAFEVIADSSQGYPYQGLAAAGRKISAPCDWTTLLGSKDDYEKQQTALAKRTLMESILHQA